MGEAQQGTLPSGAVATEAGAEAPVAAEMPERVRVLKALLAAHETWFDVQCDFELGGRVFPGFAAFHEHGERYVLSRKAKLWGVSSHEYVFFEDTERLDEDMLAREVAFMESEGLAVVDPSEPDHMASNISLVVIADGIGDSVARAVRKVRFRKSYRLGLEGWTDLRLAVIDLGDGEGGRVITNAAGKTLRPTLEENLRAARRPQ